MRFEHPQLLWLLPVLIPGLALFAWWAWRTRQRLLARFVAARLLPGLTAGVAPARQRLKLLLLTASIPLLWIVLARPQLGFTWEEARSKGLDIIVAIDTSKSMLATDVQPSRLRRAQLAALDLRRIASADRLGLVAFAGSAFLQCPLSLDDEAFRQSVEILDANIIPQGGTALSEAILSAQAAFKDKGDNHKVLVLFTDGEDHDGAALETAAAAAKDGLRIFTIGVGTPNGELIRITDVQGRVDFLKDDSGNAVKSRLNEDLLRQLAESTGGFYMRLSGAATMNQLHENGLARLPKSDLASNRVQRHHERYQWLLGLALVLLFAEMFLPDRPGQRRSRPAVPGQAPTDSATPVSAASRAPGSTVASPARPANATAAGLNTTALWLAAAIAATLLMAAPANSRAASPSRGLKLYQKGEFDQALREYEDAIAKTPDDARLRYNAGTAAFQAGRLKKAEEQFSGVLTDPDLKLQQQAYYNLGNTRFRLGEDAGQPEQKTKLWEQSVQDFESSLKLDPNDADARHNLEFVRRKLEELKKSQQQKKDSDKNKEDQQNKDDRQKNEDQKNQQNQKNEQDQNKGDKPDQQKDGNQQKPGQDQQQQQQQEQQQGKDPSDQDKSQQQQGKKGQDDAKDKEGQGQPQDGTDQEGNPDGAPQQSARMQMTQQQAVRLLEALKSEERTLQFRPILRTNRQDRVYKDW